MKLVTVTTLLWLELGILAVICKQSHSDSLFESFESGYVKHLSILKSYR
ncbi:hypothetical protein NC653_006955 [Populus alba x Populus x berolinensis]|uniref:Uncharacterized protein n=1 Tax=Populus alba x Populus x berolinensis TaxID=444605 RepID=A0AAD6RFP8_9ROSI|nr:hypothetical protein NC653_006955 [Populus alba x Populus x berolinensis]